MTLYFHRSQALYQPDDVIQPGNWGRVIQGIGPAHGRFYPEYVLESLRRREFPEKPSRLLCAFAFENFDRAAKWNRVVVEGIQEHIYAVTVPENALTHRGNVGWIEAMPLYRTFDGLDECVRNYWKGVDRDPEYWEVAVVAPLTVQNRLSRIEENGHK
jgi:uncharacterized protein DUF2441